MPNTRVVELRLRELGQLFDPLDPSSPEERDLNHRVEEFIVESLKEVFANEVRELVVHFDQPATMPDEERIVVNAISMTCDCTLRFILRRRTRQSADKLRRA
jgi:hypothetical protein